MWSDRDEMHAWDDGEVPVPPTSSRPAYTAQQQAVEAGTELLSATGYGTPEGPWLDMGVAVNAGIACVGKVGGAAVDFTALGDTVNVAARMQGEAAAGELLIREGVGSQPATAVPTRTLSLRGHDEPIEVLVMTA